jgi:hypothetical protein
MLGLLLPSANAAGMDCGSTDTSLRTGRRDARAANAPVDGSSVDRTPTVAQRDTSSAARGFDCGCQSCTAVSPTAYAVGVRTAPAPKAPILVPTALRSIEREPLDPPPQGAL